MNAMPCGSLPVLKVRFTFGADGVDRSTSSTLDFSHMLTYAVSPLVSFESMNTPKVSAPPRPTLPSFSPNVIEPAATS